MTRAPAASALLLALLLSCGERPRGPLAYVTNERDGTLTVIETAGDRVVATWKLGGRPRGVRVSADGRKLYAACGGSDSGSHGANEVTVIDTTVNKVVGNLKAGDGPWGVAVGP